MIAGILLFAAACSDRRQEPNPAPPQSDVMPTLPMPSPTVTTSNPPAPLPTPTIDVNRRPDPSITTSAVTPDGALWYAFDIFDSGGGSPPGGQNAGLYRLSDGQVSHYDVPHTIRVLELSPDGALYVGAGCGVLTYQAGEWETLLEPACDGQAPVIRLFPINITFAADGDVWVGDAFSLARYDGRAWQEYGISALQVVPAPDGTIWARGWDGRAGSDCCLTHITGSTWDTYTWSAEIPAGPEIIQALFDD